MANAVYTKLKDFGAKTGGQVIRVPIDHVVMGKNYRIDFDENHIRDLAVSIKLIGQQEPAHGYYDAGRGKVVLTRGENRLRAILLTREMYPDDPVTHIDVLPCEKREGAELALEQYTENHRRRPFNPMEQAHCFRDMRDGGMTTKQISESTGETEQYILQRLSLLNAPEQVQEAVATGAVSQSAAATIARTKPEKRAKIVEKIGSGKKVTVAEAQEAHSGFAAQVSGKKLDEVRKRCHALAKKLREGEEDPTKIYALSDMIDFGFRVCQCIASVEMSVDDLFEGIE